MKKADQFIFPTAFTGSYPNNWAGYTFLQTTQQNAYHPGIDWNWGAGEADYGKPVQCIANGQVVHQSRQDGIGYGIIVVVKHELSDALYDFIKFRYNIDARNIYSFYAHLKDEIVSDGQNLNMGDLVGYVGKSGTTVSHLHQELYKAVPGTSWRYWPTLSAGWTKEKLKQYYIDTYDFVTNQPLLPQQNETLESCKTQLEQEIKNKNEVWQELQEVKSDLEGTKSQILSYENFQKQLAITLNTEDDQAKILGAIVKYNELEDQLRQAQKKIEDLQQTIATSNQEYDLLKEKLEESVEQSSSLSRALSESTEKYKGLEGIYKKLEQSYDSLKDQQGYDFKKIIGNFYYRTKK